MAAGYLSPPGSSTGPCWQYCQHTDCNATRNMAQTPCHFCQEPIGYGIGFYNDYHLGLVHRLCLLRSIEAERSQDNGEEENGESQEEIQG